MRAFSRVLCMVCLCGLSLAALAQTTVDSFSPTGTVKQVRQVQARFGAQMVAFGDMRQDAPFDIDCAAAGKGRWVDGANWSYDFEQDLPAGVACRFTLKPGLQDLGGAAVAGAADYRFNTGGPAVVARLPYYGPVDEQQLFVLGLDTLARDDSIAAHAYCRADGINEKIPVRLLAGAEREQVLQAQQRFVQRHLKNYGGTKVRRGDPLPLTVLQCARRLPAGAKMSLVWGAGVASASGLANTEDQVLDYTTRPDFTASLRCARVRAKGQCIPFLPLTVALSAPVRNADARAITLTGPNGVSWRPTVARDEYVSSVEFTGPFPEKSRLMLALPEKLKDDAGRSLLNQARFPMAVLTDDQPPLVKFPARFGIIESRGDRMLPVTVRNVEAGIAARLAKPDGAALVKGSALRVEEGEQGQDRQIIGWLQRMSAGDGWQPRELYGEQLYKPLLSGVKDTALRQFTLPKPGGRRSFEVIGVPLRKPGFYVVELASPVLGAALADRRKGKSPTAYVSAAALVTNMVVHFKLGASSSLAWVTSLDKGEPVAAAQVTVRDCRGHSLWQGKTGSDGVAQIAQRLDYDKGCEFGKRYFISARSGGDMTFTLSDWDSGIESWRFNVPTDERGAANTLAATVFDRSLLRAGETVHMKHFLRRHTAGGIELAPAPMPEKAVLMHQGSEQRYELPLAWNAGGSAEQSWPIPADAKLGWYEVMLGGETSGRFRVEQFRVPTMRAVLQGPKEDAVQPSQVALDVQLSYLSGGGASGASARLRTVLTEKSVAFEDYADFSFAAGDVTEGVVRDSGFNEDDEEGEEAGGSAEAGPGALAAGAATQNVTLDRAGGARVVVAALPKVESPKDLLAELSYQDANGETLSSSTRVALWPSSYVIGIQPDAWVLSKDALKFKVAVLDLRGRPVAGAQVAVDFFQRVTYSHRRRLIGGFYAYESSSEVQARGMACEGKTDERGLLACAGKAPESGNVILRARTQDAAQRVAVTSREIWVAQGEDWWFKASDGDRIDLLPELKRYEPGQNATFQLRMPFRQATALVTVEREGVLDSYVRQLSGSEPVLTIPMKKEYAPNVFVSALVVRGRVAGVQPTALVDLGKPAYKMGLTPVRVGWAAHELKVQIGTDRQVYKVRERAQVNVRVTRADGSAPPAGAEVALAAVDLGLLELMPNDSWDLLEHMMRERSLQVETATAQMQVVGKRHFGRKAVAHGGGGGKGGGRELFDTLLFWKARVTLDENGEASVQVPLNDSLTGFRIVAIASADTGMFGTGRAEIRSSQDLMLLSGLPPLVREGDRFRAGFTLRNTTQAELKVKLSAQVSGKALRAQSLVLEAGQARQVGWDYQAPDGVAELDWEVAAQVDGAGASDRLRVRQKVKPLVPVQIYQATLLQLDGPHSMTVQLPGDALAGRGGVQALFSARLGGDMPGVREYMSGYPYTCFEQVTSRAIALRDKALWRRHAAAMPAYLDSDGLLKYFPGMEQGSDSLTAYVLSAVQEAGFDLAPELKTRMEDGLLAFVQGKVVRHAALPMADLPVRKLAALEALSRSRQVNPADIESFAIVPDQWPTSALIDWYLLLHRTVALPQRAERLAQVQQILKSRLTLQGTTMGFSTERSDNWWWLMVSGDVNANRLLLAMLDNPAWQPDMGRLARGALGRQRAGRWDTTVANVWGVLALDKFAQKFESETVRGSSNAAIGSANKSVQLTEQAGSGSVLLPWPRGSAELALSHAGSGKPWVTVQSLAALPLKAPLSSGFRITRTVTPLEQATTGKWSAGDIYRVKLDLEAQADMTWVVVDDPIPAGASILGTGLGKDSQMLASGEHSAGWVWPAFQERTFDAFRSYYEYVPKGKWSVEYTVRLNNAGQFALPPTRVEAMYKPEMFGAAPNAAVSVK